MSKFWTNTLIKTTYICHKKDMASVFLSQADRFFVLLECFFKHAKGSSKVFYIQIVVIVLNLCTLMLLSQSLQLLDLELQQRVVL